MILFVSLDNLFPIALLPCQREKYLNVLQGRGIESYLVKTHFPKKFAYFTPIHEGNEKIIMFDSIETHLIGFLDPINVSLSL